MDYILIAIFASAFVLAIFWFVAMTIGRLRVVKNSPTLDDIQNLLYPNSAEQPASSHEENRFNTEGLSETVQAMADSGDKLGAVKAHKENTGLSLMDAKKEVESYLTNRKK